MREKSTLSPEQNEILQQIADDFLQEWNNSGNFTSWDVGDLILKYLNKAEDAGINGKSRILTSLATQIHKDAGVLRCYAWVSERFPLSKRDTDISWSHHRFAAGSSDPIKWIQYVRDYPKTTTKKLKTEMNKVEKTARHYRGSNQCCLWCDQKVSEIVLRLFQEDQLIGQFCSYLCLTAYSSNITFKKPSSSRSSN